MYKLYYKPTCPYSKMVLESIAGKDIMLTLCDINEERHRTFLIEKGGKQQVPFLYSEEENVAMYESRDIIDFLGGDPNVTLPEGAACSLR